MEINLVSGRPQYAFERWPQIDVMIIVFGAWNDLHNAAYTKVIIKDCNTIIAISIDISDLILTRIVHAEVAHTF